MRAVSFDEALYDDLVRRLRKVLEQQRKFPEGFPRNRLHEALAPTETPLGGNSVWAFAEMMCTGWPEVTEALGDHADTFRVSFPAVLLSELVMKLDELDFGSNSPALWELLRHTERLLKLDSYKAVRSEYDDQALTQLAMITVPALMLYSRLDVTRRQPTPKRLLITALALISGRTFADAKECYITPIIDRMICDLPPSLK